MEWMEKLKNGLERVETRRYSRRLASVQAEAMSFFDHLKQHLTENPEPVFAVLRRVKPVLIFKNTALVTRFEDVQEVLSRDSVFQVTYKDKMEVIGDGGNFFLGMQNSPEYERDQSHMRTVIRRQDLPQLVQPFVAKTAESLVLGSGGQHRCRPTTRPRRTDAIDRNVLRMSSDFGRGFGFLEYGDVSVFVHRPGQRPGGGRGGARGGSQGASVVGPSYRRSARNRTRSRTTLWGDAWPCKKPVCPEWTTWGFAIICWV